MLKSLIWFWTILQKKQLNNQSVSIANSELILNGVEMFKVLFGQNEIITLKRWK